MHTGLSCLELGSPASGLPRRVGPEPAAPSRAREESQAAPFAARRWGPALRWDMSREAGSSPARETLTSVTALQTDVPPTELPCARRESTCLKRQRPRNAGSDVSQGPGCRISPLGLRSPSGRSQGEPCGHLGTGVPSRPPQGHPGAGGGWRARHVQLACC